MLRFALLSAASAALANASSSCGLRKMDNLVTFGDSYTDESRLGYFINHDGDAPPAGLLLPPSNSTATGGKEWGRIVAGKTGADYYNYAVSGATCSNKIVERNFAAINAPFPAVLDYEIPAFEADVEFESLYPDRRANNTVYALWIGTNDLGNDAFLTDSQAPGDTISTFVDCVWDVFDAIYKTGGRHFVLLNQAPLQFAPMYAAPKNGGVGDNQYWGDKSQYNQTEIQYKMLEYTTSVNTMFDYGVPFNLIVEKRWPGSSFAVFDVNSLMLDIRADGDKYLDSPANVTGFYHHCFPGPDCVDSNQPKSSFLWYDALHPSERTESIIADEFIEIVKGESKYGTYYHK